jgi:hypothetical protein
VGLLEGNEVEPGAVQEASNEAESVGRPAEPALGNRPASINATFVRELSSRDHPEGENTATETRTVAAIAANTRASTAERGPDTAIDSRLRIVERAVSAAPPGRE